VVQRFTHYDDERWFVIVHIAIEAAAAPAIRACPVAQQAVRDDDPELLQDALETIAESLSEQTKIMRRMTEGNDTQVFANEFRPYYEGFDDVVYEGVDELEGTPQSFRGSSGAQSSILPSIDATLGIEHEATEMTEKLGDMRSYMPPLHRSTIDKLDRGPSVSEYVTEHKSDSLRSTYNDCVTELEQFRRTHFKQVIQYIREVTGDTEGTGGTNYMAYLRKLEDETKLSRVGEES
jgi:indoleamine 2,3-dioxygenase